MVDDNAIITLKGAKGMTERMLASIWSEVLGTTEIAGNDHFLELGGDSISAALCLNRIRKQLDREIPVSVLLAPDMTLAKIAALIDDSSRPAVESFRSVSGEGR